MKQSPNTESQEVIRSKIFLKMLISEKNNSCSVLAQMLDSAVCSLCEVGHKISFLAVNRKF